MSLLDDLLALPDPQSRKDELMKYAQSIGIDTTQAIDRDLQFYEEKLVIAIFDKLQTQKIRQKSNMRLTIIIGVLIIMLIGAISQLPKLFQIFYPALEDEGPTFKGVGKDGEPIMDEQGRPVRFELMDGKYEEYDAEGYKTHEYFYEKGDLIRTLRFNRKGQVESFEDFDKKTK